MGTLSLVIKTNKDTTEYTKASQTHNNMRKIAALWKGLMSGSLLGSIDIYSSTTDPVAAAGTITITYASIAATDTVLIGGTTFTCVASGANGTTEFNKVTDATATAASLVTAINANTTTSTYVVATSALGVVTVTAKLKGTIGNAILMSKTGTGIALVQMVGGTGGPEGTATTVGRS